MFQGCPALASCLAAALSGRVCTACSLQNTFTQLGPGGSCQAGWLSEPCTSPPSAQLPLRPQADPSTLEPRQARVSFLEEELAAANAQSRKMSMELEQANIKVGGHGKAGSSASWRARFAELGVAGTCSWGLCTKGVV